MFHRTQLLLDRANAYQKSGQWQSAVALCETLFETNCRERLLGDALEALLRLGLIYSSRSQHELATEYYHLVLTIAERSDDWARAARAYNGQGIISQRSGQIDAAENHYGRAKQLARASGDRKIQGDIELNLGIIANIRGELKQSLEHYHFALAAYEEVGQQPRIARVLNNLGMLYSDLGKVGEAAETLERAVNICRLIGDIEVEGIVLTNQAELYLSAKDLERARAACDEAFEISSRLGNSQLKAEVLKLYGVLFRLTGKPHLSESHLRQAIDLAASLQLPLIQADAYRELALVLREEDRNREALDALNVAHSLFTALQAKQEQADIDKRFLQLENDFLTLVERWGESIEAKDQYTKGHCQRVAEYACKIAEGSGIESRYMSWFRMGAFLHDVGKTEIPEEILNKPGRLSDEERSIMDRHTIMGWEMLRTIEFPWDILPMVRSHHERWDGKGYPDQLKGEEIPLSARILHIADVFDALTTTRSYRSPLQPYDALNLMQDDVGSFDPDLLAYFASLLPSLVSEGETLEGGVVVT